MIRFGIIQFSSVRIPKLRYSVFTRFGRTLVAIHVGHPVVASVVCISSSCGHGVDTQLSLLLLSIPKKKTTTTSGSEMFCDTKQR